MIIKKKKSFYIYDEQIILIQLHFSIVQLVVEITYLTVSSQSFKSTGDCTQRMFFHINAN